MSADFDAIFASLRSILERHSAPFEVTDSGPKSYCLEGKIGPAVVRAWGGKVKRPTIPVAWVQVGKAYVSFHLMGIYGNRPLLEGMSKQLKARMQGKTCFNFKRQDDKLF